jgi:dihydroorotase
MDALKDDTIDVICSNHLPFESDAKQVEFEYAASGMETLEATYGAANHALRDILDNTTLIEKISINPRKITGLEIPTIAVGNRAELTVFDPESKYRFGLEHIRSKSVNSGFIGRELTGRASAVINNNQIKLL